MVQKWLWTNKMMTRRILLKIMSSVAALGLQHRLTPSYDKAYLVVKCTLVHPEQVNDWRRTTTFHTLTKIGDKNCKVIVDSESNINAVLCKVTEGL